MYARALTEASTESNIKREYWKNAKRKDRKSMERIIKKAFESGDQLVEKVIKKVEQLKEVQSLNLSIHLLWLWW